MNTSWKIIVIFIGIIISTNIAWYVSTQEPVLDAGDFIYEIQEPKSEKYNKIYNSYSKNGQDIATYMNSNFNFPHDVYWKIEECNSGPAYYPNSSTILICYYFLEETLEFAKQHESKTGKEGTLELANGLASFVIIHEVAHLLIDVYDLPVVGNEEIAADQLATLIILPSIITEGGVSFYLSGPMEYFASFTREYSEIGDLPFWHKHPLGEDRSVEIMCLSYGKLGPEAFTFISIEKYIPSPRLETCEYEFETVSQNWVKLLKKHLKPDSNFESITFNDYTYER